MRAIVLGFLCIAACGGKPTDPAAQAPGSPDEPPAGLWVHPTRPSRESSMEYAARVVASPESTAEVGAPFRARVVRVRVAPGQIVAKGDPIVDVVMPEVLDAAASFVGVSGRLRVHRDRQRELEALLADNLVERSSVFEQRAILSELEAERARALAVLNAAGVDVRRARRELSRGEVSLRAPIAGTVAELDAHLGETREPASPPFARLVADAVARVEVRSPDPLPQGASIVFEATDGRRASLAAPAVSHVIDPIDGTHVTWFSTSEPSPLPPSLRGRARLTFLDAWELPTSAISTENAQNFVMRRTAQGQERVAIALLIALSDRVLVRGALRESDDIAPTPSAPTAGR